MRLGAYPCVLDKNSLVYKLHMVKRKYQKDIDIDMNTIQTTKNELEKAGLKMCGNITR